MPVLPCARLGIRGGKFEAVLDFYEGEIIPKDLHGLTRHHLMRAIIDCQSALAIYSGLLTVQ
jgi:hypothetical protein